MAGDCTHTCLLICLDVLRSHVQDLHDKLKACQCTSTCCHRSDSSSHLELRVVSSAQIEISQITSSERSLMYSGKNIEPRMEPSGTPALTGYWIF